MTLEGLGWIVVVNGVVQLVGLILLILGQRDIARMTRAVAGLVYQEEGKTRTLLTDLLSRDRAPGRPAPDRP
jgi:hypothetical protein